LTSSGNSYQPHRTYPAVKYFFQMREQNVAALRVEFIQVNQHILPYIRQVDFDSDAMTGVDNELYLLILRTSREIAILFFP
jgi:hypothetical protein